MSIAFAAYPSAFVFETPGNKKIEHLLWGDFIRLLGPEDGDWINVRARGKTGWMLKSDVQEQRLLEVNFIDIGQGDGCFIVTPGDKFILIDAGESDNMIRFLRWRFNLKNHPEQIVPIQNAIISHSDSDHYRGFAPLFDDPQFQFEAVYHNGIVERNGDDLLGPRHDVGGRSYLTDIIIDRDSLGRIIDDPALVGRKLYPNLLKTAFQGGRAGDIRMLCTEDRFLSGYEEDKDLVIRLLRPVPEKDEDGKRLLRWFGSDGKTKNGHSVILKVEYGQVKIMLGGDLNIPAEEYLLQHYTGLNPEPPTGEEEEALIVKARKTFESDIAKACHHGSADFTNIYLRAVNPIATVVSSGDNESHSHPRPDALGAFGKTGRGDRPLIFSTELARSAKETIRNPKVLREEIKELFALREKAESEEVRVRIDDKINKLLAKIERSVSVYGLINLRTDGRRVVLAQKLESPRPRTDEEWDIHRLEPDEDGRLRYISKH